MERKMNEYRIYFKQGSVDIKADGFRVEQDALIFSINEEIISIFKDWQSLIRIDEKVDLIKYKPKTEKVF